MLRAAVKASERLSSAIAGVSAGQSDQAPTENPFNASETFAQLGLKVKSAMAAGELVADELIIDLVKERLRQPDCDNGFILDGFPRTLDQAKALVDAGISIDHVVEIAVDDEEIVHRLSGRRVHPGSGRVYHIDYNPPKQLGLDDVTGEPLIQRDDDSEETIWNRLKIYHDQTKPLIEFYQAMSSHKGNHAPQYHAVPGIGAIDEIYARIQVALGEVKDGSQ
jgi:adenylate kinase